MSWQKQNIEGKSSSSSRGGLSKIRKRGCSSSSSSSLVQRYRFKRAILVGKRGGSTTPVPTWKTTVKSPSYFSPVLNTEQQQPKCTPPLAGIKAKEMSVSARKLAATLWEINKIPSPKLNKDLDSTRDNKNLRSREERALIGGSVSATLLPPHLSDPSYSPISETMDIAGGSVRGRRTSVVSQKLQVADYNLGALDSFSNVSLMEIEASRGKTHNGCIMGSKTRLKDVSNGLTASKELVKVLNRIWGAQEQHLSSKSLFSALKSELDRAHIQVDQLIKEQRSNHNEIEYLMKLFAEQKAAWKRKERDRIRDAIACIAEELEIEKKLRRQTERLNKKLGKELAEMKESLLKATKELESEKRAKEILEQVCDELARGMGEDRAEVEELKRQSVKVREEVEKEREMLQLADVLREERVQMKLSEAKYHFEEKNAAVERLRNELEAYLRTKKGEENGEMSPSFDRIEDLEAYLKKIQFGSHENGEKNGKEGEVVDGEGHEGDDSGDSDMHSIELNMDNNSQSYKWSYAYGNGAQDDLKRASADKGIQGRKSIEKIQWGNICLERGTSNNGTETKSREHSDEFDEERLAEIISQMQNQDHEDEITRYRSIKSLRDHILSTSKMSLLQSFSSPTRQWGQSLALQDGGGSVDPENEGDGLKRRSVEARGERRSSTSSRQ
ncbi:hypothetical protein JRO89_XS10G0204900 [Xanthoceras sorbifolium]|uniref:Uncharacterized protein n=1 Tax=Xanthoceras sorbifolium TaxID=99658 RepID=A0ABQ8HJV6_9ROSI|nr:hypothetical protein JRO89_XS10G0204900 [Xanthoceras sorbifolium]